MSRDRELPAPSNDNGWMIELSEEQRLALPAVYHRPHFDGLAEPQSWICSACWGDYWTQLWPCPIARENGVELARSLKLGWAW